MEWVGAELVLSFLKKKGGGVGNKTTHIKHIDGVEMAGSERERAGLKGIG